MIESGEDLSNSSGVRRHAKSSHDLSKITTRNDSRRLVVDTSLETSRAPVDELNGSLGLDGGNSSVDILRDDITSVHHAASHIFTMSGIALGHHGSRFESGVGDFSNRELFVIGLFSGDDGGIRGQHEMDSGIGDEVSLEFSDIDVEGTIESQRSSQRRDDLSNESVEIGVSGSFNIELSSADIVDSFVIEHDSDIGVFKEGVSGQDGVVGFNDGSGDLRRRIDSETELGLLAVIDGESFEEEGTETGTSTTTDGVEHHETLETGTVISELSDSVECKINDFLTNGVVTSGEVVGSIFLTGDKLFGVEELSVGTSSYFIDDSRFEIKED
jgi:hypothetical protein